MSVKNKELSIFEAVSIAVGVVMGAGIFKTPILVAQNSSGIYSILLLWLCGGRTCKVSIEPTLQISSISLTTK